MNITDLMQRGGSKLEITRAIIEQGLDKRIHVPQSAWMYAGGSVDVLWRDISRFPRPLIVRGSHRNDYHGFIDVIPTIPNVYSKLDLEKAIKQIEEKMKDRNIRIHCEDWGQSYTPEAHILVQEQIECSATGFMLRHPHTGSLSIERRRKETESIVSFLRLGESDYKKGDSIYEQEELSILYEAVEALSLLEQEWVHQVEYGISKKDKDTIFFQARPFKKKQPAADFKISIPESAPYIYLDDLAEGCFGITPPEGIELEFFNESKTSIHEITKHSLTKEYGVIIEKNRRLQYPIWTRFGNMRALVLGISFTDWQSHDSYRIVKRAEYTMLSLIGKIISSGAFPTGQFQGTYISNGREGLLVPSEYMR